MVIRAIKTLFMELTALFHKMGDLAQWYCIELAGTQLRLAAARDQLGALQHL